MKYKDIKDFNQRCEEHPDHQSGMVSYSMIQQRMSEEIDELREYIEQRTWVGLTDDEVALIAVECSLVSPSDHYFAQTVEAKLKDKNT
jgi:hypothetical protein